MKHETCICDLQKGRHSICDDCPKKVRVGNDGFAFNEQSTIRPSIIRHLGDLVFPQKAEDLVKLFTQRDLIFLAKQGLLQKGPIAIGFIPGMTVTPKGLWISLSDSGWDWYKKLPNNMDDAYSCSKCGNGRAAESHTCPYKSDINQDYTLCDCCNECTSRCSDER